MEKKSPLASKEVMNKSIYNFQVLSSPDQTAVLKGILSSFTLIKILQMLKLSRKT